MPSWGPNLTKHYFEKLITEHNNKLSNTKVELVPCSAREKVQQLRTQLRMPEKHLPGTQRAREGGQVCARGGAQCDERTEAMPADHMQLAHALVQPQQS